MKIRIIYHAGPAEHAIGHVQIHEEPVTHESAARNRLMDIRRQGYFEMSLKLPTPEAPPIKQYVPWHSIIRVLLEETPEEATQEKP